MMECMQYSSVPVSYLLLVITSESQTISVCTDGNRLCTCGGDGIVRVLDPSSKLEVISKRAPEVLQ